MMTVVPGFAQFGLLLAPEEGGAPPGVTISYITTTYNALGSANVTAPATINAGDILIYIDGSHQFSTPPTAVTPSGFTKFLDQSATLGLGVRVCAHYKVAVGNEDGTTLTGMSSGNTGFKFCMQFRGSTPFSTATPSTPTYELTNGNPASQSILAAGQTPPLIVIGFYGSPSSIISPRTMSVTATGELAWGGSSLANYVKYKIYDESPEDVSIDMDDEGSNNVLVGFFIECA